MRARLCLLALVVVAVPLVLWAVLPVGSTAQTAGPIQNKINHKESQIGVKRRHERVLTSDISAYTHRIDRLEGSISRLATRRRSCRPTSTPSARSSPRSSASCGPSACAWPGCAPGCSRPGGRSPSGSSRSTRPTSPTS